MKLRIFHTTDYRYLAPVSGSSNDVRLTPRKTLWQTPHFFLLRVLPSCRLKRFQDLHGNLVTHFEIEEPHQTLLIETQLTISTSDPYRQGLPPNLDLQLLSEIKHYEDLEPFLQPTHTVQIPPQIWRAAIDLLSSAAHLFELAHGIMRYVHDSCQYCPGFTTVSTTSAEFFEHKKGVCQDFAHLMLALCRSIHLPARYISGYLYDAKRKDVRGAHATHAWVEVWLPQAGWVGLDPTNNCLTRETYVTIAVGRDYHDVAPITGSYWGSSGCTMDVSVDIEEV